MKEQIKAPKIELSNEEIANLSHADTLGQLGRETDHTT